MTSPVSDAMIEAGHRAWSESPMDPDETLKAIYLAMKAKEEAADTRPLVRDSFDPNGDNDGGELMVYADQSPADDVERVARALATSFERDGGMFSGHAFNWVSWTGHARAALSAIRNTPQAIEAREVGRMREAVLKAVRWFEEYVSLHMAKNPPNMVKAASNQDKAAELRTALSTQGEGQIDRLRASAKDADEGRGTSLKGMPKPWRRKALSGDNGEREK